jgi:hypothetical protein
MVLRPLAALLSPAVPPPWEHQLVLMSQYPVEHLWQAAEAI